MVLLFSRSLALLTFTKCVDAALSTLKAKGMHILNYLNDWLVVAQSETVLQVHKHKLLNHLHHLRLTGNMQKSMIQHSQHITLLE